MDVVVDTDVFSFIFRGDSRGDLYDKHLVGRRVIDFQMAITAAH